MNKQLRTLTLSALFLALGLVLPFFTGQIPQIGSMLLPMHIPALLCGLICGWQYGAVVGFIMPLMRSLLFTMPPLLTAVAMAFELAAYGGIAGFLYSRSRWQCVVALYRALIAAMVGGRIVWAAVRVVMTGVAQVPFTWEIFLTGALLDAIPVPDPERVTMSGELEGDVPSPLNPPSGCCFHTRCKFATERCGREKPALAEVGPGHQVACHLCAGKTN